MRTFRTILISFLLGTAIDAQTFRGGIGGAVSDATGAAITGAQVKLESASTGLTRTATTNAQGQYTFPDLPVGVYTVSIAQVGFEAKKIENVEVAVSRNNTLDI